MQFQNIAVTRCRHWALQAHGALFQDLTVDTLTGGGRWPSFMWGCAFVRVTLRGLISGLMFRTVVAPSEETHPINDHFLEANERLYEGAEWALDISKARFSAVTDLQGIPPALVRRDPATQFVMTREQASVLAPRTPINIWAVVARIVLSGGHRTGMVIALGHRSRKYRQELEQANSLARQGLLA